MCEVEIYLIFMIYFYIKKNVKKKKKEESQPTLPIFANVLP